MRLEDNADEFAMDGADLYREEVFTDRKLGSIRQLTPVTAEGAVDGRRKQLFLGQAQILTTVGALPLSFEIEARTLAEAVKGFAAAAQEALESTMKELQELRREAASSIIIPEAGGGTFGGPPMAPGGGKLKLR